METVEARELVRLRVGETTFCALLIGGGRLHGDGCGLEVAMRRTRVLGQCVAFGNLRARVLGGFDGGGEEEAGEGAAGATSP